MLTNIEIRQKYPVFRKGLNDFEGKWITCGCICTVRKKKWKDHCDYMDIEYQKCISHSVIRLLSLYPSFPRMLQMYPASHSYFMSIDKPTVVLKRFSGNSLSELCLIHWDTCNFLWLFLSKFRILKSQKHQLLRLYRVSTLWRQGFKWDNQIAYTYQAKLNQHSLIIQRRQGSWLWFIHVRCICILQVLCCTSR